MDLKVDLVQYETVELSSAIVDCFQQLPLQSLRIQDRYIDDCQSLALALPNVGYLVMEMLHVGFEDLAVIARYMPNLQYLCTDLLLEEWPLETDLPHDPSSPSPCRINSAFMFEEDLNKDHLDFNKRVKNIAWYVFCALVKL